MRAAVDGRCILRARTSFAVSGDRSRPDGSPAALLAAVAQTSSDLTYNVVIPLRKPAVAK